MWGCNGVDNREIQPKTRDSGRDSGTRWAKVHPFICLSSIRASKSYANANNCTWILVYNVDCLNLNSEGFTEVQITTRASCFISNHRSQISNFVRSQLNQVAQYMYDVSRDWNVYRETQLLSAQGFYQANGARTVGAGVIPLKTLQEKIYAVFYLQTMTGWIFQGSKFFNIQKHFLTFLSSHCCREDFSLGFMRSEIIFRLVFWVLQTLINKLKTELAHIKRQSEDKKPISSQNYNILSLPLYLLSSILPRICFVFFCRRD